MNEFKCGDVVRHKATGNYGPNMSVTLVDGMTIRCTYWHTDEKVFKRADFFPEELEEVSPNREISFR
jgi:uncharacterized protein YodC (DUF2158 family)